MWGAGHGQRCTEGDGPSQGRLHLGPTCQRAVACQEGVGVWGSSGPQGQQQGVQHSTEMRASSPRDRGEGREVSKGWRGARPPTDGQDLRIGAGKTVRPEGVGLPWGCQVSCPNWRRAALGRGQPAGRQADLGPVLGQHHSLGIGAEGTAGYSQGPLLFLPKLAHKH